MFKCIATLFSMLWQMPQDQYEDFVCANLQEVQEVQEVMISPQDPLAEFLTANELENMSPEYMRQQFHILLFELKPVITDDFFEHALRWMTVIEIRPMIYLGNATIFKNLLPKIRDMPLKFSHSFITAIHDRFYIEFPMEMPQSVRVYKRCPDVPLEMSELRFVQIAKHIAQGCLLEEFLQTGALETPEFVEFSTSEAYDYDRPDILDHCFQACAKFDIRPTFRDDCYIHSRETVAIRLAIENLSAIPCG